KNAHGQKEMIFGWRDGCSLKIHWNKPKDHLWFPSCISLFCQGFNCCIRLFELLLCLVDCAREKWNQYPGEFFMLDKPGTLTGFLDYLKTVFTIKESRNPEASFPTDVPEWGCGEKRHRQGHGPSSAAHHDPERLSNPHFVNSIPNLRRNSIRCEKGFPYHIIRCADSDLGTNGSHGQVSGTGI